MSDKKICVVILTLILFILIIRIVHVVNINNEKENIEKLTNTVGPEVERIYYELFDSNIKLKCVEIYRDTNTKQYMVDLDLYTHDRMEKQIDDETESGVIDHNYWYELQEEVEYLAEYIRGEIKIESDVNYTFGVKLYSMKHNNILLCHIDDNGYIHYVRGQEDYKENNPPDVSLGGGIDEVPTDILEMNND